jgi:hypothetical protein
VEDSLIKGRRLEERFLTACKAIAKAHSCPIRGPLDEGVVVQIENLDMRL